MNVLHPFNQDLNPYVSVVQDGLQESGVSVVSDTLPFWKGKAGTYDLVHFQWPETLFDWRAPSHVELLFLNQRLHEIKGKVPIVFTYHNQRSNHCNPENSQRLDDLYEMILNAADAIIHLGDATKSALQRHNDTVLHRVIPIPVYEKLYSSYLNVSKSAARKQLGLPQQRNILLCFGNFRNEVEQQLVIQAKHQLSSNQVLVDAPKWFKPRDLGYSPLQPVFCARSILKSINSKRQGIRAGAVKTMSDEQVALHFAACDVVFVQRTVQLNSGNLPMGFLFGKVVVGPDTENTGYWLRTCNNPVFDFNNPADVARALKEGIALADSGKGDENKAFALEEWTTAKIGEAHAELYRKLIHR